MIHIKYIPVALTLTVLVLVSGCKCSPGKRASDSLAFVTELQDAKFPEDSLARIYVQEDSIACIENTVLGAKGSITAEDLLALKEIHTLERSLVDRAYYAGHGGLRLANRFMRMHYASGGSADNELIWVEAVQRMFTDYCKQHKCSEERAWKDFMDGINFLECGTQQDINLWCYVKSSVEYYHALAANKALLDALKDTGLKALLLDEYRAWNEMNDWRQAAYVHIRMDGQQYSALPMDHEGNYAGQAIFRREMLETERKILIDGQAYTLKHEVVTTPVWDEYLEKRLFYHPDAVYEEGSELERNQTIVRSLDASVKQWLDARHAVTRYLPGDKAVYYDNVTADYHWVITNEAEKVPEGYD